MTDEPVGWANSSLRTFCNDTLLNAFPISYQAIISNTTLTSNNFSNNSLEEGTSET